MDAVRIHRSRLAECIVDLANLLLTVAFLFMSTNQGMNDP